MTYTMKIPRWLEVMAVLHIKNEKSITDINQYLVSSYPHTIDIINDLLKRGLVSKTKVGRRHILKLTANGKNIAKSCHMIDSYVKNNLN